MKYHVVADLSGLPSYGFGTRMTATWGTFAFMALEGFGFALAVGLYLYLAYLGPEWPLSAPLPDPVPGTIVLAALLASAVPNHLLAKWARSQDLRKVRIGLVIMVLAGAVPLIVRIFEFPALNVYWDSNAYGSILWTLLGLHTAHLLTDFGDTLVLAALMFTRHGRSGKRFSDVEDNAFYWDFVVATWVPIYLLIYWAPRL